jgi:hypothetical protein
VVTQAQTPRVNTYQVPPAAMPSRDAAIRRQAEADWAVRMGGATGGAKDEYIRNALKQRTPATCTHSLNSLNGQVVCVDGRGIVRAQSVSPGVPKPSGPIVIPIPSPSYEAQQRTLSPESGLQPVEPNRREPPSGVQSVESRCPGNSSWNGYSCISTSPFPAPSAAVASLSSPSGTHGIEPEPVRAGRPPTGEILTRSSLPRGQGELSVVNGLPMDAVVTLHASNAATSYITFYVRAGENTAITDIAQGEYELAYTLGENWTDGRFATLADSVRLNQRLTFADSSIVVRGPEGTTVRSVPGEPWKLVLRAASGSIGARENAPFRSAPKR